MMRSFPLLILALMLSGCGSSKGYPSLERRAVETAVINSGPSRPVPPPTAEPPSPALMADLDHWASAGLVEAGWQAPPKTLWNPWIRAGITYGSGDSNAKDGRHGTFFQILPTPRPFARFPFYNMMNNIDRNVSLTLRPTPQLTLKSEFHSLRLANKNDLWYQGGGAYQPWTFGFTGRDAKGATGLANLYDVSADWNINPKYSLAAYFGYSPTKSALQKLFPGSTSGAYSYVEATWRF